MAIESDNICPDQFCDLFLAEVGENFYRCIRHGLFKKTIDGFEPLFNKDYLINKERGENDLHT